MSTLRANDGTALELKEGTVIDQDGNTLAQPGLHASGHPRMRVHVMRGGWGLGLLLFIGIPLLLFAGTAIAALFIAGSIAVWLLRPIVRFLSGR
jgi:hypothetical protein